jgi:large subunit ribosomal protein L20
MSRSPRSVPSRARRNKVLKQAKGMRGRRKNNITTANAAVDKSLQHNYIGLAGAGIEIDRKVLSDLAIHEPAAFKALVDQASKA